MKDKGAEIFLPELNMSLDSLRLHLFNNYNIKIEQMNHKMQTGGTADSAMSNDPMIGGTMASSMARGGKIGVGDYVKVKPMYGNIYGEVTFANDNIVVIKNPIGKTFMFHPHDLMKTMGKGGKIDIGDTVHIVDNKSMFKGKSGVVLSQLTPTTVIVQIVVDGNDRNVVVRKSGLEYVENLEEGGSMTADDVYSYDTQDGEIMDEGGSTGESNFGKPGTGFDNPRYENEYRGQYDKRGLALKSTNDIKTLGSKLVISQQEDGFMWNLILANGSTYMSKGGFKTQQDAIDNFMSQQYGNGGGVGLMRKGGVLGDIYSIESANQFQQLITTYNELSEKFGVVNYFLDHNDNSVVFLIKEDEQINTINLQKYVNSLSLRGFDVFDTSQNKSVVIKTDNSQGGKYVYFKLKLSKIVRYAKGGGVGSNYAIIHFANKKPIKKRYDSSYKAFSDYEEMGCVYAELFNEKGIRLSRYPKEYAKGGGVKSFFGKSLSKAKELGKKGYEKSKAYAKDKVKEQKRKIAVDVLNDTDNKVKTKQEHTYLDRARQIVINKYAEGGGVGDIETQIDTLYSKSGFINTDFNWRLKLLEMLQDQSIEAYNIYQKLTKKQKADILQEQFEVDNDMGSDGDGDIETTKENLEILLDDAKNGKKYAKGGATPAQKRKIGKVMHEWKEGELNIGKSDKKVKSQKQAVAIALSQAGLSKKEEGGKMMGWKHKRK